MTVCAAARDQVAAMKTSSVKRNIMAGRCGKRGRMLAGALLFLFNVVARWSFFLGSSTQHGASSVVAGGGALALMGYATRPRLPLCDRPIAREKRVRANEQC